MAEGQSKRLFRAYVVVAVVMAPMLFFSAWTKLSLHPGAVQVIRDVVGVPLAWFPVLAACEIAGGVGLLAGILRPALGVAAGLGLVLYFVGAIVAHVRVGDWPGVRSPILPLILSVIALGLRLWSKQRVSVEGRTRRARAS